MPSHPTRKAFRANERRREHLAREPIAFRHIAEDRVYLAENPNAEPHAAVLNYSRRTLAHETALDALKVWDDEMIATFPGRDSLGRRNPRMARRSFA
jgi:hypothetical protein